MAVLDWNETLALGNTRMDGTHVEFVQLLNELAEAPAGAALARIDDFLHHTEAHFAEEERWMNECGFPPVHCHTGQHQMVLNTAREVRRRIAEEGAPLAEPLATAVADWFRDHVASMDYMLNHYMGAVGYEPAAGDSAVPLATCGDSDCACVA